MAFNLKLYKKAGLFETLSTKNLEWKGSIKDSFESYGYLIPEPQDFISFYKKYCEKTVNNYLAKSDEELKSEQRTIFNNLIGLHFTIDRILNTYFSRDAIPSNIFDVLNIGVKVVQVYKKINTSIKLFDGEAYSPGDSSFLSIPAKVPLAIIKSLVANDVPLGEKFLISLVSGDFAKISGKDQNLNQINILNEIIDDVVEKHPIYELFTDNYKLDELYYEFIEGNLESFDFYYNASPEDKLALKIEIEQKLKAKLQSGLEYDEMMEKVILLQNNKYLPSGDYNFDTSAINASFVEDYLKKIENNEIENTLTQSQVDGLLNNTLRLAYSLDYSRLPEIYKYIFDNTTDRKLVIERGFGSPSETEEYYTKNPDEIPVDEKIVKRLSVILKPEFFTKVNEIKEKKVNDLKSYIEVLWKEAIDKNIVKVSLATENYKALKFIQDAPKNFGIDREEIKSYASNIRVFEVEYFKLQKLNISNKQLLIGNVNLDDNWSGLYVPKYRGLDGTYPAIFIKTDINDALENQKELARNLNMSESEYANATLRHELSHAMGYLGIGQEHMRSYKDPYESKEMNYLLDHAEVFARAHGDIPYLRNIFQQKLRNLVDNPKVFQAVKNQWLEDIENSYTAWSLGGSTPASLTKAFEEGSLKFPGGTFEDPMEIITKKLERQRRVYEDWYAEQIKEKRRENSLNILREMAPIKKSLSENPSQPELQIYLSKLQEKLKASMRQLVFDIEDLADLLIKGYYQKYYVDLTNAISSNTFTTDRPTPESELEKNMESEEKRKQSKTPPPPSYSEVSDFNESMIKLLGPDYSSQIQDEADRIFFSNFRGYEEEVSKMPSYYFDGEKTTSNLKSIWKRDVAEDIAKSKFGGIRGGIPLDVITKFPMPKEERQGFFPHLDKEDNTPSLGIEYGDEKEPNDGEDQEEPNSNDVKI